MPWIQINFDTDPEHASGLEDALLEAGSVAVTLQDNADQPLFEPALGETPLWSQTRVTALFDAEVDLQMALRMIEACYQQPLPPHRSEILEDKDWEREWIKSYQPMCFGDRLWICPSWIEPPEPTAVNILLDPGLAFGTGTHPTTAQCLEWLDAAELKDKVVVDYGCGSGILAIAALLLGASKVIGVDIDPQALLASRDNARRNNIEDERFELYYPTQMAEHHPDLKADLVLANILAGPLVELSDTLIELAKPGADIVLSGVLDVQADSIRECYSKRCEVLKIVNQEEWIRVDARKPADTLPK
ncbi:ribosomal protein L11 methyltransferase [Sinobacterium caligoides]|uniref:Ribosomal protein L11 methyltransferase n=1 Tax=Sinobacterium caligoides TaxID=933926 RepID=A0A3N2DNZ8_9GAMM|nr:50S ribosomal protein L11 methyltransferase [Sinobacterium caligoides]ROS01527.1 ribosomal protein L11 methyltransferase [Sinobacterium caligoides]